MVNITMYTIYRLKKRTRKPSSWPSSRLLTSRAVAPGTRTLPSSETLPTSAPPLMAPMLALPSGKCLPNTSPATGWSSRMSLAKTSLVLI